MGQMDTIEIKSDKAREVSKMLFDLFATTGIHGRTEMPEDLLPSTIEDGSVDHLLFLTLTISLDYQRDAIKLWQAARLSYDDPMTRYLFNPVAMYRKEIANQISDMQKYGLSKKPKKDAYIWRTVGLSFLKKWGGDPLNFIADCSWDAPTILVRLKGDRHQYGQKTVSDFPYLRGDKIGPLWLRMLRDNLKIDRLKGLEKVPIPVDVHVARSSLSLGVVQGSYKGPLAPLYEAIRKAWFDGVLGYRVDDRKMIALDVDEPLWHLSKYGCTKRDKVSGKCPVSSTCEMSSFCVAGTVDVRSDGIELNT